MATLRPLVRAIEENTDWREVDRSDNTSTKHVRLDGTIVRLEIETRVADRDWK